ncbi:unnamed protein product [Adineta ricciae]|uniref:Uncharacterized protein n=3 Tax=Adineta ricciae TaxID=249248 RepID=A0A814LSQ5_ADIRI|nr:unnamed protein product [Adineta ricciae]
MYAYVELSNVARTDSIIQSLSWMNFTSTASNTEHFESSHDGWLATGNVNNIVSVTYTSIKSDENLIPLDRTNFNLRAHRTEVRLVSWNVPYEKLATVDEKGVIFVWVKHDNRWSLELINDRSHPVTGMAWSHDGRMTVICYEDDFILAGSVTGQRYWSTVLNVPHAKISAVTWMPDVSHVILGTTGGQLIVMDHHGNTTDIFPLSSQTIKQLVYSCNKFYPEAPDNNATKFVNEDYVLACSLENGQVLFLTHYLDQSPITVDTHLQNIKMDWSSPGEILAVGGHRCLDDMSYVNEVLFYTRRGEFLYRLTIPQTSQSLSALCWAHGNEIVFIACGCFVYTIWITYKPMPSMLTLCQMKIKQELLYNSIQNLDKLHLPNNLKEDLLRYYRSTIKGFLPDQKHLHIFVCNPLKSHLRLQCTMKRIDNERDNQTTAATTTTTTATANNLSGAVYVLYLEYLGGLIPLLTARRTSKLCPDFIIYDPKIKTNPILSSSSSFKLNASNSFAKRHLSSSKSHPNTFHNISNIHQSKSTINTNRSGLITNRNSIYVADTGVNNGSENLRLAKNSSDCSSGNDSDQDNEDNLSDLQEKQSRKRLANKANKLCTIAANIWGTRFKFYGHSAHLPDVLGSVTYKTSFLHLQPRQMTVTVANNSNIRKQKQHTATRKHRNTVGQQTRQSKAKKLVMKDNGELCTTQQTSSSPQSSRRLQRTSIATTTVIHRYRQTHVDSSNIDSSSTSPINLSRSTSPATSIANFVRPISPPCIQVKEPLSPKFTRASSITMTNYQTQHRHCSPPPTVVTSITNNIDASTASATTTLIIDSSSDSHSHENANNQTLLSTISNVPENCFEPEAYRNLYPLNNNQQKKLSFSDPTLNQTTKLSRRPQASPQQQIVLNNSTTTDTYLPVSSLAKKISKDDKTVHTDDDNDAIDDDDDDDDDDGDIETLSSPEEASPRENIVTTKPSRKKYTSPRHRMMTCTSGMNDSTTKLSPSSDVDATSNQNDSSFYVMQNRPPLWNEQSQVYQLDFGGRVTLESAKNFQIEFKGKQVIQFGRIENNCYTLDFEWPFSPLQAFAVALANITQRLK